MTIVHSETHGGVVVIRFANPPTGLAGPKLAHLVIAEIAAAQSDPRIAAIVLTGGEAGVFIRHYDVAHLARAAEALTSGKASEKAFVDAPYAQLTDIVSASPKPVIGAINGICMGGGFELALACDVRIAGRDVKKIGLPEIRIGIFPGCGGTQRLPRLIGEAKALDFILRGATVDAAEAFALGLVTQVADDPVGLAISYGEKIATRNPDAVAAAKAMVRSAFDKPLPEALVAERLAFGALLGSSQKSYDAMQKFLNADGDLSTYP